MGKAYAIIDCGDGRREILLATPGFDVLSVKFQALIRWKRKTKPCGSGFGKRRTRMLLRKHS